MADSRGILFQREQFLVPPEENIRLSRIANGYEETGDEEQQHVEEGMEEDALPPRLPDVSPSGRTINPFPSQLSGTRFYNYFSFYSCVLQYLRDRNISMFV
jgi:hypothetical protein